MKKKKLKHGDKHIFVLDKMYDLCFVAMYNTKYKSEPYWYVYYDVDERSIADVFNLNTDKNFKTIEMFEKYIINEVEIYCNTLLMNINTIRRKELCE